MLASRVVAQELPVRTWNVRDGLIQSRVNAVLHDSDGFVWFATWEGASRFDGRRFENYGSQEGLPNPLVWCVAEAPDHTIWFGTHGGGLARVAGRGHALVVDPSGPKNPAQRVFEIEFDRDERMWIVTERGVFVAESSSAPRFEHVDELGEGWSGRVVVDERGDLVFVSSTEIVTCSGRTWRRAALPSANLDDVRALAPRRAGGFWVAHVRSLDIVEWDTTGTNATRMHVPIEFGPNTSLYDVSEDDSGRLWVGTSRGLLEVQGETKRWYDSSHGLPDDWIQALRRESEGGLWIGTHQGGAAFLPDTGVEHHTRRSGLGDGHAVKLVSIDDDIRIVTTEVAGVFEFGAGRARRIEGSDRPPFDRIQHDLVRDGDGRWWIGTSAGIFRTRGTDLVLADAERVGESEGLIEPGRFVFRTPLSKDLVVGTGDGHVLGRRSGEARFEKWSDVALAEPLRTLAEANDGTLWIGDNVGLFRRRNGRAERLEPGADVGGAFDPRALLVDSRGWLWIGRRFGGVAYSRDPGAEVPRFERITTRDGLASDAVFALAEDRRGGLYFGTGRGVQRWSPKEPRLEPVGADDGLSGEWITDLAFDARGDLWVATANGVSRIHPEVPRAWRRPPRVRFTRCAVAGAEVALPAAGTFDPPDIEIAARDSQFAFEFVAVDPVRGGRLLYETRLEGVDREWSSPSRELAVRYGGLGAGSYRFGVRSIDPNAEAPSEPTFLAIEVVPPLWARGWFVATAFAGVAAAGFVAHRLRLRRELALERVRTQIAGDLHDDIGAGLAQIAISSEHARRAGAHDARAIMGEVAGLARGLRESMSDLVWAVDPRLDTLADVVARMRHFAHGIVAGEGMELDLEAPDEAELARMAVGPDLKRNLFLFSKEALANVVRHSGATHVAVKLVLRDRRIVLHVRDDGVGFDPQAVEHGNGLRSLERRARDLGAKLSIDSAPGRGTRVVLDTPLPWRSA